MTGAKSQRHWDNVYDAKRFNEVSWYQGTPERSLELIKSTGVPPDGSIIDVGGGASTLVDHLLDEGYTDVTVLDIAANAFAQSRARLGPRADAVNWIVADITRFDPQREYQLWHDRAVLHFLTDAADRDRYVRVLNAALAQGGYLVLSTFGPEGPLKCSGLDVRRYDINRVEALLGEAFDLLGYDLKTHTTPQGSTQQFLYSCWIRRGH